MRFYTDFNQYVFENPAQYPKTEPYELQQIRERSAGGTLHVETFAGPLRNRVLSFSAMSEVDYQGLLDWYVNKVNGMAEEFTFEDEFNKAFKVRFTDRTINFKQIRFNRWQGNINLEIIA